MSRAAVTPPLYPLEREHDRFVREHLESCQRCQRWDEMRIGQRRHHEPAFYEEHILSIGLDHIKGCRGCSVEEER